jgi:colicin import membrane protein
MKQLMQQAGTGAANSTGTAARTSGPSGAYGQRIAALIKQNTIYPGALMAQISGDPRVTILVTLDTNSGTVLEAKIERSSGVASWDQAALDAINRVHRFPPPSSGEWPRTMIINAGPRDPS